MLPTNHAINEITRNLVCAFSWAHLIARLEGGTWRPSLPIRNFHSPAQRRDIRTLRRALAHRGYRYWNGETWTAGR